jgi:endogenous inhibitor of DNA gyrase (YacG/DUF329 family)
MAKTSKAKAPLRQTEEKPQEEKVQPAGGGRARKRRRTDVTCLGCDKVFPIMEAVWSDKRPHCSVACRQAVILKEKNAERYQVPKDWLPLPSDAPLDVQARWVAANLYFCRHVTRREDGGEDVQIDFSACRTPAPCGAAVAMLEAAVAKHVDWMNKTLPALVKDGEGEEDSIEKREKVKIEEIEEILESFRLAGKVKCSRCKTAENVPWS